MRKSNWLLIMVFVSLAFVDAFAGGDETPLDRWLRPWIGGTYIWEIRPTTPILQPGPVTFVVRYKQVSPHDRSLVPCDTTEPFHLIPHGRLVIEGSNTIPFTWHDTGQMSFSVIIPEGDTSGFDLQGSCGVKGNWYFVTTGDTVEVHWSDPRLYPRIRTKTWEHPPQGQRKRGEDPQMDSLWGDIGIVAEDTSSQPFIKVEVFHHDDDSLKRANVEKERQHQAELERSPLVGQQFEYIEVGGVTLVRKEGEHKFYPTQGEKDVADMVADLRRQDDSLTEAMSHVMYDALLTLVRPEQLTFARQLVDTLTPIDTVDMYRVNINRGTWGKLIREGITVRLWNDTMSVRKQRENQITAPPNKQKYLD